MMINHQKGMIFNSNKIINYSCNSNYSNSNHRFMSKAITIITIIIAGYKVVIQVVR